MCDLHGAGAALWESAGAGSRDTGAKRGIGLRLDSESGPWRNFELLLLPSMSVFERDLAGVIAAELEWGLRLRPVCLLLAPRPGLWGRASAESGFCSAPGDPSPSSLPPAGPGAPSPSSLLPSRGFVGGTWRVDTCAPRSARVVGAGRVTASGGLCVSRSERQPRP